MRKRDSLQSTAIVGTSSSSGSAPMRATTRHPGAPPHRPATPPATAPTITATCMELGSSSTSVRRLMTTRSPAASLARMGGALAAPGARSGPCAAPAAGGGSRSMLLRSRRAFTWRRRGRSEGEHAAGHSEGEKQWKGTIGRVLFLSLPKVP